MTRTNPPVTLPHVWQVGVLISVFAWMTWRLWTDNQEAGMADARDDHPSNGYATMVTTDEVAYFPKPPLFGATRTCPICLTVCEPGRRYCSERCFEADNPPQYDDGWEDDWEPGDDDPWRPDA